jgi:(p)ppGpp synthase/HD superfamily hydrolase
MDVPEFARGSPLLEGAFQMALYAHEGPARADGTTIHHPVEVAQLLHDEGFDEVVVAAGLLHDVVEDTTIDVGEIEARFGPEVARLVAEMTDRQEIEPYERRKAEHRERVSRDRSVAAIYAADKISGTHRMLEDPRGTPQPQLEHYLATLDVLCRTNPDLPFLGDLRRELQRVREARGQA